MRISDWSSDVCSSDLAGEWTRGAGPDVSRPAGVEMTSPFSQTYAEARAKFLSLASERGATVVSAVHPTERGAEGEDLAIDIATFGDPDAEKTLFLDRKSTRLNSSH